MLITLELMQILDAIDRNGSFEKAANELHKVTSALTYNIRKFETRLGVDIFDRTKQRAKLTPLGQSLLEQGRHLLNFSSQIEQNILQMSSGWERTLKIAYDEIINEQALFTLLKTFQKNSPKINFDIYNEILGGCADALISGRVDMAIGITKPLPNISDLIYHEIGVIQFVFAVSPDHPLAKHKEPLAVELIKEYSSITARDSSQRLPAQSSSMYIPEQQRVSFSNLALKKAAQIAGIGAGFLPLNHIKNDIKAGRLIVKKVERPPTRTHCYVAWNKNKTGKAQAWFIEHLMKSNIVKNFFI